MPTSSSAKSPDTQISLPAVFAKLSLGNQTLLLNRPVFRQTSLLGEAVTYFLTRPLVQSGEGVNRLESGVLAGTYRPISSQTQLNDALIESHVGLNS